MLLQNQQTAVGMTAYTTTPIHRRKQLKDTLTEETWKIFYHPTIGNHNMATSYDIAVSTHPNVVVSPSLSDEIVCINYYTLSGIRILKPIDGIYIKEVIYKNGEKQRSKVCIRHF